MDEERPALSGLVNALWGGGVTYGAVDNATRARMRRGLLTFMFVTAAVSGVIVGLLASALWGVAAAAIAVVVLGAAAGATLRDYE